MDKREYKKVVLLAFLWDLYEEEVFDKIGKEIQYISKHKSMSRSITQIQKDIRQDLVNVTSTNITKIQSLYQYGVDLAKDNKEYLFDYKGIPKSSYTTNIPLKQARETANEILIHSRALCTVDRNGKAIAFNESVNNILNKALKTAQNGEDFHTVMRNTIKQFGGSGIRVNYGGNVTRSIESVVRSNLLWGMKQCHRQCEQEMGRLLGCDGVEIDWHLNQRPTHIFMGGRQYALGEGKEVNGKFYPSVDDTTQGAGLSVNMALNDYGCLHYETYIILGISKPRYTEQQIKELNANNDNPISYFNQSKTGYEWQQVMRALERAYRRELLTMKLARGDKQLINDCKLKMSKIKLKYDDISKVTGITQDYNRFYGL